MFEYDKIDDLIRDLTKPIFVYRMSAGAIYWEKGSPMQRAAATRRKNAKQEIHNIVTNYRDR